MRKNCKVIEKGMVISMSEEMKNIEQHQSNESGSREHGSGHHHSSHRRRKRKKKNKALQITFIILACVVILAGMGGVTYAIISYMGGKSLEQQATTTVPVMTVPETQVYETISGDVAELPLADSVEATTEVETEKETETVAETEAETETVSEAETTQVEADILVDQKTETKQQTTVSSTDLKEGQILYNGQVYQYNSDIRTFALMGIDTMGTMNQLLAEQMGGQSDMLFLAVLNPDKKKMELIGINRNAMTTIDRYTTANTYYDTVTGQITLQHAYGTGGADSCERTVAAIDRIMYMVPIHGYFSMNMGAISKLNDAIGGVTLTPIESVKTGSTNIVAGQKVTLLGQDAFNYVKYRAWKGESSRYSADRRLERQKQYLTAFLQKLKTMVKNDLSIPMNLYNIVSNYSVTDVSVDEMMHLVNMAIGYEFDASCIRSVPGTSVMGAKYEEFYVDYDALYDMVIDVFYEPVN